MSFRFLELNLFTNRLNPQKSCKYLQIFKNLAKSWKFSLKISIILKISKVWKTEKVLQISTDLSKSQRNIKNLWETWEIFKVPKSHPLFLEWLAPWNKHPLFLAPGNFLSNVHSQPSSSIQNSRVNGSRFRVLFTLKILCTLELLASQVLWENNRSRNAGEGVQGQAPLLPFSKRGKGGKSALLMEPYISLTTLNSIF